jgi:hypothetical protein
MKLNFCPTIGERLYYIADTDDDAPMLELRFQNEFAMGLTGDRKREIASKTLKFALSLMTDKWESLTTGSQE